MKLIGKNRRESVEQPQIFTRDSIYLNIIALAGHKNVMFVDKNVIKIEQASQFIDLFALPEFSESLTQFREEYGDNRIHGATADFLRNLQSMVYDIMSKGGPDNEGNLYLVLDAGEEVNNEVDKTNQ